MEFEKKSTNIYKVIMLVILTATITFLVTSIVYSNVEIKGNLVPTENDYSTIDVKRESIKELINKYYLGEIDEKKLEDGIIKGYVNALEDPYTTYMTKEEWADFQADTMGNYAGIGIRMLGDMEFNEILVVEPIPNTPAEAAGIKAGDIILKVDDIEYSGKELSEASNNIKGEPGTKVKLTVRRDGEIYEFEIERANINISYVESKIIENEIGYIKISDFDDDCAKDFKEQYNVMEAQGITALIVDLRNNPGGLVNQATEIANTIVPKGNTLLITADKNNKEEITKAKKDNIVKVPVIVLINENSASASEILAGALKDNNVAKIVGMQSYGKGVIQQVFMLKDGSSIKITTEEYYTPARIKIHKIGIIPDVEIDLPEGTYYSSKMPYEEDTQLQKAVELLRD